MARYLIGIDLGTTNSALAYIDLQQPKPRRGKGGPHDPALPRAAAGRARRVGQSPAAAVVPLPARGRTTCRPGPTALPWDPTAPYAVGEFARNHGARVPGRLVTSAKSWLCHAGVDRSAPLLPWSAPPDVPRISPVEASARYLRHLVESWNHVMAQRPARRPPGKAGRRADGAGVVRRRGPQPDRRGGPQGRAGKRDAAGGAAGRLLLLAGHALRRRRPAALKPGARCLVVDVGGGTSDFSLIEAVEQQGELGFVRQAVGDHLLLGGDNMDLALAKFVETKLPGAGRLDAAQYGMLTQACRQAKETLLGPNPPAVVHGHGGRPRPAGHRRHAQHTDADAGRRPPGPLRRLLPPGAARRRAAARARASACTRWACPTSATRPSRGTWRRSCNGSPAADGRRRAGPAAILFNGGVFQPAALRERLLEVMRHWYDAPGAALAAAGADQPVARPGRGLGRGLLRLAAAHRRPAHRRRHRPLVLRRPCSRGAAPMTSVAARREPATAV